MIDALSLLVGIVLGVLLTGASFFLWGVRRRHRPTYMSLDEVRAQIDAENDRRIEQRRVRKANTARNLSGRGVA